ncbi:winged helix-turn-helix domain-containing protein [Asticcacaulis benevestitus]|uniref:winged helix-turn-helix domain-containing protein n=1 Tax=Asticcacaulis benevestitus TaxID=347481 RepID=UPI0009DB3F4E
MANITVLLGLKACHIRLPAQPHVRILAIHRVAQLSSRLNRILNGLGYRKLSARPKHHEQNEYALEGFKNSSVNYMPTHTLSQHKCGKHVYFI